MFSLGIDSLTIDPQRFAMDYHLIGFRECVSEVARYLMNIEGMDAHDPLRMRIMSHLQCFMAQIEISSKSSNATPNFPQGAYQPSYTVPYHQNYAPHSSGASNYIPNLPSSLSCPPAASSVLQNHRGPTHSSTTTNSPADQSAEEEPQTQQLNSHHNHHHHESHQHQDHLHYNSSLETHQDLAGPTYTDISTNTQRNSSSTIGYTNPQYMLPGNSSYGNAVYTGSKPYRPWGAEMAY